MNKNYSLNKEIENVILRHVKMSNVNFGSHPLIVCVRNTDHETGDYVEDMGENACDMFYLQSVVGHSFAMQGRSRANKSYIDKFFADGKLDRGAGESFNYILPCYLDRAFAKGNHHGYQALRQNRKFPVFRSIDEEMGNDDDYVEYGWQFDNFHGWMKSRGCWVVDGKMSEGSRTSDWKVAHEWIYEHNFHKNRFDAICLDRKDFEDPEIKTIRFGSRGNEVRDFQREFGLRADGIFGYMSLQHLLFFQKKEGARIKGVFDL